MVIDRKQIEILQDTIITGPELELMSNGSNADGYHTHSAIISTKHTYTTGNLTTDIAAIGATPTTLYIDIITDLGGSATVPNTMTLKFVDAGQITIDAAETLTIYGTIDAGFWHIFDAVDEFTSLVHIGAVNAGGGPTEIHPEWWGALGDNSTDDTIPIQKMLRVPSEYGSQLMKLVFGVGKIYRVSDTLQIGPDPLSPGVRNTSCIIEGNSSTLLFNSAVLGANVAVKCGNIIDKLLGTEKNAQVYYMTWSNLNISSTSGFGEPGSTGVEIGSCQFSIFTDSIWGGFDTVVATRPDQYGGNANRFSDINIGGWTSYGWLIGNTFQANNWTIEGGRTQQGEGPAMRIEGCTEIIVRNIDFSVVRANIIEIEDASHIVLDTIYSENFQIYWEAYPLINDVKLIYITGASNVITINNCRINGVGLADVTRSDAAYGIYMDGYVNNVTISGNIFTQHYIADIYVGENTDKIFIKADNNFASPIGNSINMPQISDMSGRAHNEHRFAELYSNAHAPWPGNQKNLIASPSDFTNSNVWTLNSVTINETTLAPDGVSLAQVVKFPNTTFAGDTGNPSSFTAKNIAFSLGETLNNKTIILQYWIKALNVLETALDGNINAFATNLRVSATPTDNSGGGIEMAFTLDGYYINDSGWILMKHRYKPTGHVDNWPYMANILFSAYSGGDGISVGLYGVQIYVESDEHVSPISPAWGVFDKVIESPETIPKLINYTGEVADFIMETIPDPSLTDPGAYSPLTESILLDGTSEVINYGHVLAMTPERTDTITVNIWMKTSQAAQRTMIENHVGFTGWLLNSSSAGLRLVGPRHGVQALETSTVTSSGAPDIVDGIWHMVTWTSQGNSTISGADLELYIDGVQITGAQRTTSGSCNVTTIAGTSNLLVGDDRVGGSAFDGYLCHASGHDFELTPAQVAELYGQGTPQDLNSLSFAAPVWWDTLGDGDAAGTDTMIDLIGGSDGTTTGMDSSNFIAEIPAPGLAALRSSLIIGTIPALRRNISDITEQVNSIRLLMKEYGFMKPYSVFDMTGLTMYMSPKFGAQSPIDMDPIDNIYFAHTTDPAFYPLTNTGTNRPTYLDGYINNLPTIHFDVTQDQNLESTSSLDKFITISEFVVLVVVQVESIDAPNGLPVNDDCIVGSPSGGQFGIFLGNTEMIYGHTYDGGSFVDAGTSIPGFQIPFLVEYKLYDGYVSIKVNDEATVSLASNDLTAISSIFSIGGRGAALPYFDGYMAELIILNQYNAVEVEKARNMLNDKYNLW